jgi:hypothetical protein
MLIRKVEIGTAVMLGDSDVDRSGWSVELCPRFKEIES